MSISLLKCFDLLGSQNGIVINLNLWILLNPICQCTVRNSILLMNLWVWLKYDLPEWYKFTIVCLNSLLYLLFFFPVIFIPLLFVFYFIILVHFFSIYPKRWVNRKRWLVIKWYIKSIIQDFGQPVSYLIPAIFFSGCIVFAVSWLRGKKSTIKHRIPFAFFLAYILVIFRVAFLCRKPGSRKAISLVLFETWGHTFHMHAMFVENIIMFIPFGVLQPILFRKFRCGWACVLTGFICSCSIEILQHITQTGYLQLDDVVTNTTGTLLGWFTWRAWKVDRKIWTQRESIDGALRCVR